VFWMWALSQRFPQWPLWLLGFSTPLAVNLSSEDTQVVMMVAVVTAAVVAAEARRREWVRNGILGFMFVVMTLRIVDAISSGFSWPGWVLALALGWAAGELLWRFGNTVDELEQTRALVADQAILQERRRIARDVHDLVGHSLSVVLLHVTGARHLVHSDPDEAERALLQAEEAGRQSLAEIRRTVGLLRDETDVGAPAVPSADLTDVRQLCDDFTGAGQFEALTNVSRHTVGAEATVTMTITDQSCEISVTNRGGETIDLGRGSGFGLVSMRERAKSVGGSLIAGPTRDGWVVEVSLPVDSAQARR